MNNIPLTPPMPFVWPEPRVSAGFTQYASALPFEAVARTALSVFGVVSAIDAQAVDWMEGYLSDNPKTQLRLVISIHPTCRHREKSNLILSTKIKIIAIVTLFFKKS